MNSGVITLILVGISALTACDAGNGSVERWYSQEQVVKGAAVFAANCAACHGDRAQGLAADWKKRQPDGSYPPPPLNGTAHAWHHSLPLLLKIVQDGGALFDGKMPGFEGRLSEEEQLAAITWFQSFWSDDVYRMWQVNGKPADSPAAVPIAASTNNE